MCHTASRQTSTGKEEFPTLVFQVVADQHKHQKATGESNTRVSLQGLRQSTRILLTEPLQLSLAESKMTSYDGNCSGDDNNDEDEELDKRNGFHPPKPTAAAAAAAADGSANNDAQANPYPKMFYQRHHGTMESMSIIKK